MPQHPGKEFDPFGGVPNAPGLQFDPRIEAALSQLQSIQAPQRQPIPGSDALTQFLVAAGSVFGENDAPQQLLNRRQNVALKEQELDQALFRQQQSSAIANLNQLQGAATGQKQREVSTARAGEITRKNEAFDAQRELRKIVLESEVEQHKEILRLRKNKEWEKANALERGVSLTLKQPSLHDRKKFHMQNDADLFGLLNSGDMDKEKVADELGTARALRGEMNDAEVFSLQMKVADDIFWTLYEQIKVAEAGEGKDKTAIVSNDENKQDIILSRPNQRKFVKAFGKELGAERLLALINGGEWETYLRLLVPFFPDISDKNFFELSGPNVDSVLELDKQIREAAGVEEQGQEVEARAGRQRLKQGEEFDKTLKRSQNPFLGSRF